VVKHTSQGWPVGVENACMEYLLHRNHLTINEGMLMFDNRIVIPRDMRVEMLTKVHTDGHFSLHKSRQIVAETVWWPSITTELKMFIDRCEFCQKFKPRNRAEPMRATVLPERPWMRLGADLMQLDDKMYLIVLDYFSRWIEIEYLERPDSQTVVDKFSNMFSKFGIPEILGTDGGPQFSGVLLKILLNFVTLIIVFLTRICHRITGARSGRSGRRSAYLDARIYGLL
jgi:hypothetical protein